MTHSDDPDESALTINLSGRGVVPPRPEITLSSNIINFGDVVKVGSIGENSFEISNTGNALLQISDVSINDAEYIIVPIKADINPGQNIKVTLTFTPKTAGDHNAVITVSSNDPSKPQVTLPVKATSPEAPAPRIELSTNTLNFGEVDIATTKELELIVTNAGTADLQVSSISLSGSPFTIESENGFILTPAKAMALKVSLTPSEARSYSGSLKIISNDPGRGEITVQLSGIGKDTPKVAEAGILPAILNFGEVQVGQSKNLSILVSNSGTGTLRVLNIVSSSTDFVVSESVFSVEPGGEKTFLITFLPSELGNINETLDIPTNDPNKPVIQIPLRGTVKRRGEDGQISSSISLIEFGEIGSFGEAEFNLPIRNEGSGTLTISNVVSSDLQVVVVPNSLSIPPQERRTLRVRFRPRPGRDRTGEITLNSDDPNQPVLRIPWEASVLTIPRILSVVSISPETGASDVGLETEIVVTFSEPLLNVDRFVALSISLFPKAESGDLVENFPP